MVRALGLLVLVGCTGTQVGTRDDVAQAMQRYQAVARTVNPDSMAAFFTREGTLFEPGIPPIRTRDSIRAFLASFPGAKVHIATATPDSAKLLPLGDQTAAS